MKKSKRYTMPNKTDMNYGQARIIYGLSPQQDTKIRDVSNYMTDNYNMSTSTLKRMNIPWKQDSLGQYANKEDLDKIGMSSWKRRQIIFIG